MRAFSSFGTVAAFALIAACSSSPAVPDATVVIPDAAPTIDAAPTHTFLDSTPPVITNQTMATFSFHASADSTFECRVDDALMPCMSPMTTTVAAGQHTFIVTATGASGTTDQTPPVFVWTVDLTVPNTILLSGPAANDNSSIARFQFVSSKPDAEFECLVDEGQASLCLSPFTTEPLLDGPHSATIQAIDAAGNVDPTPLVIMWTVDTSTPDTQIDSGPSGTIGGGDVDIAFSSSNAGDGAVFSCALDGGAFAPCTSPVTVSNTVSGPHVFQVAVTNLAGSVDPTPATDVWTVDVTAPVITIIDEPTSPSTDTQPSFTWVTDETSTTLCGIDNDEHFINYQACTSTWQSPEVFDLGGACTFRLRATDAYGNQSDYTYPWTIIAGS